MRKKVLLLVFLLFTAFLSAADIDSESETKKFHPQLNIGFGADFSGKPGLTEYFFRNNFGFTAGLDLKWKILQQTKGDLFLGFGFDFQYWVPTFFVDEPDGCYVISVSYKYYQWLFIQMHYLRIPLKLKISYAFKVGNNVLSHIEPEFSIGINNNFIFFDYNSDDPDDDKVMKRDLDEDINHWKISGTWAIGLNFIFNSPWIFKISLGGDFGSQNPKSDLFYNTNRDKEDQDKSYLNYILYSHHEFMMFETGYRF